MPTYNRADFLKEALDSVLAQTLRNIEVIVVDNNSTDGTEQLIASYDDTRIVYVRNDDNIGAVGNYNAALRLAKGEYVYLFSDDDIMCLASNLEEKAAVLDNFPNVGVVHSGITTINEFGSVTAGNWAENLQNWSKLTSDALLSGCTVFEEMYFRWNFVNMPTVLLRRELLIRFKLEFNNQLKYLIDWNLWLQLALVCDFYYIDKAFIKYRLHSSNESRHLSKKTYFDELLIAKLGLFVLFPDKCNAIAADLQNVVRLTYTQVGIAQDVERGGALFDVLRKIKRRIFK